MWNAVQRLQQSLFISGFADEISSDFKEQLKACKELGISFISLRGVDGKNIGEYTVNEAKEHILPMLKEYGIKVSSIGSPIGKIALDDEEGFENQCIGLQRLCDIAKLCDCQYIRIFSFYPKEGSNFDEVKDEVISKLKVFVEIAKRNNIILIHENEKDVFGDIGRRCLTLLKEIDSPYFKAVFDPANFVQMKQDPMSCFKMLKEYIVYIHIKDACYADDQNVVCGSGDGKLLEILTDAILSGYEGFLTLEPHLVIFDSLKDLELKDVQEIIKVDKGLDPKEAYAMQYYALLDVLKQIGG